MKTPVEAASKHAFAFQNRKGVTYYLHEGKTKTGKPRYFFAKTIGDAPLAAVPEGFEVDESMNGVVSVRRKTAGASEVPAEDVKAVEAVLAHYPHLAGYVAKIVGNAIVVFEPDPRPHDLSDIASRWGHALRGDAFVANQLKRTRYSPVMKFEPKEDGYAAFRMTFRGKGGWSYPIEFGKLVELGKKLLPSVGTDEFFNLM